MNMIEAAKKMKEGQGIRRPHWVHRPDVPEIKSLSFLFTRTPKETDIWLGVTVEGEDGVYPQHLYSFLLDDLLADDWEAVDLPHTFGVTVYNTNTANWDAVKKDIDSKDEAVEKAKRLAAENPEDLYEVNEYTQHGVWVATVMKLHDIPSHKL